MREEEKLARDVYLTLADLYPDQRVFSRIATRAEQTHTDTMRDKLDQFNLPDPNPRTNKLPSIIGKFTGDEWGWYFKEKFALLTAKGEVSELEALQLMDVQNKVTQMARQIIGITVLIHLKALK